MKLRIVALLLFCLSFTIAFSNPVWEQTNGPYSTQLKYITSDHQGHLYAITESMNLYKSVNEGESWNKAPIDNVTAIAFDKDNNCLIGDIDCYISLYDKEFNFVKNLRQSRWGELNIHQIQVANNGNIYVNLDVGKLLISTNNGQSWSNIYSDMYDKFFIDSSENIFITFQTGTIGRSSNYGADWKFIEIYDAPFRSGIFSATYNHCFNKYLVAGFGKFVYISSDKGLTWIQSVDSLQLEPVLDLLVDDNCDFYALTDSAIYYSVNEGNSWKKLQGFSGHKLNSMIKSNNYLFCSSSDVGIIKYDFSTGTSTIKNKGIHKSFITSLDINQKGEIFAATKSGIFKTTNLGNKWLKLDLKSYSNKTFNSILCSKNGNIYAGFDSVLIKSSDDGITWLVLNFYSGVNTIAESGNGRIYVGGFGGLYYSDDDGLSWITNNFKNSIITSISTFKDNYVLIGTYQHGVLLSEDFGKTFKQIIIYVDENYKTLVTTNQKGVMFINIAGWGGSHGTYRSLDTGKTFTRLNDAEYRLNFLKIDKKDYIYAGSNYGLKMSNDNGDNWSFIGNGLLDTTEISDICFNSNNMAYLGTYFHGVFKSSDFRFCNDFTDNENEILIYPNPAQNEAIIYLQS